MRGMRFGTILAAHRGNFKTEPARVAPEHKLLNCYGKVTMEDICALPVADITADPVCLASPLPLAGRGFS